MDILSKVHGNILFCFNRNIVTQHSEISLFWGPVCGARWPTWTRPRSSGMNQPTKPWCVFFFLIFGHFGWNYAPGYCLDGQTCKQRGTHTHKCKWNQIEKTWNTSLSWFSNGTWTTYIVAYDFWNAHLLAISFRVPTPSFLAPVNTPLGWHHLAKPGSLILCCQCVKIGWTTRIGKIM